MSNQGKRDTGTERSHRLALYLTGAEWTAIEQIARQQGELSVHDWVLRKVLLGARTEAEALRVAWPRGER